MDASFGPDDLDLKEDKVVYDGFFKMYQLRLRHKKFAGGWSEEITRELFHRGSACAAVVYDPRKDLVALIDQFRIGAIDAEAGPWCLEGVAGMLPENENPEALMRKELFEEAGIKDAVLLPITTYYSTPGGCSELIHMFCALCDLEGKAGIFGLDEEAEDIQLRVFPSEEVFASMYSDRTNNGATLIGLQWLQLNRERLRAEYT